MFVYYYNIFETMYPAIIRWSRGVILVLCRTSRKKTCHKSNLYSIGNANVNRKFYQIIEEHKYQHWSIYSFTFNIRIIFINHSEYQSSQSAYYGLPKTWDLN
jgi:hypothetical protein